jgi:Rrf2 family protein
MIQIWYLLGVAKKEKTVKLITRNTDYAVRAVCYLAENKDRLVASPELVKELKMPKPFLRKIMQMLGKRGVVRSSRGIGGGFRLNAAPDKILITGLIEIFQGPFNLNECVFKKLLCPNRKKCCLKKRLDKIEKVVLAELGSITISELLK